MTALTEHFTLEELTFSDAAVRHNLSNRPDVETVERLRVTAQGLEQIRALLGAPIQITSGFRSPAVNAIVGGALNSAHTRGWAADIKSSFGEPLAVCRAIAASGIAFDQLIHEYGAWTHVSFEPRERRELLTVSHAGTQSGLHKL